MNSQVIDTVACTVKVKIPNALAARLSHLLQVAIPCIDRISEPRSGSIKKTSFISGMLLSAATVFAQGGLHTNVALNTGTGSAFATVRVCPITSTGSPYCTPTAPIYSDAQETQPLGNPMSADQFGNFSFYTVPGFYLVQVSAAGTSTPYFSYIMETPSDPVNPIFNTVTLTGPITNPQQGTTKSYVDTAIINLDAVVKNPTAAQEISGNQILQVDGPFTGFAGTFQNLNGVVNVTRYNIGGDLGAQVNSAAATCSDAVPCHLYIPPGVYSFSTPVLLPRRSNGLELTCDRNATLTYTGVGDAFGTQPAVSSTNDAGTMLDGGCALIGTSAGTSGVHFRPGQGYALIGWQIKNFSQGDGIWVDGANVVWITRTSSKFNLNGLHVTGNRCNASNQCRWDRPNSPSVWVDSGINDAGYAANAVKAYMNRFTQNVHWGILDGDIVGGSNTQSFSNSYVDNDLEGNGTAGAPYGAALTGFSRNVSFIRDYLEGNPAGIVLGCVLGDAVTPTVPTGYTAQFCGTTDKAVVSGNFLNDNAGSSEVLLNHANSPTVSDNGLSSNAACLVDNNVSVGNIDISSNIIYGAGSYTCQNGTPGGTLVNFRQGGDSSIPGRHFYGTVQIDNTLQTATLTKLNTSNPTMNAGQIIVAIIGGIVFWQSTTVPGGACGSANTYNIMFTPGGIYGCHGASTWFLISGS
jgi:hypothetical protein